MNYEIRKQAKHGLSGETFTKWANSVITSYSFQTPKFKCDKPTTY